ncbi:hypothetical protein L596_003400 [Steinernema carpocapsae]|uniref:Uncharacterized protein n=1 Tax=Steinernema carpocapsae TaxID=34508 RepID=A0A4V6I804_STECR|nr:hypothetical protein L596_003400 [Steinernema carpocapsae]
MAIASNVSLFCYYSRNYESHCAQKNRTSHERETNWTDFYVRVSRKGTIALEHALTKRFVCFNRRRRITVRKESRDRKCHFREHMTPGGFTELESAWRSGLFLGFNRKGRFQESSAYHRKRKCFRFLKIERKLNSADHSGCNTLSSSSSKTAKPDFLNDKLLFETAQLNIFYKIQATVD